VAHLVVHMLSVPGLNYWTSPYFALWSVMEEIGLIRLAQADNLISCWHQQLDNLLSIYRVFGQFNKQFTIIIFDRNAAIFMRPQHCSEGITS
jgi:hypothetical protein